MPGLKVRRHHEVGSRQDGSTSRFRIQYRARAEQRFPAVSLAGGPDGLDGPRGGHGDFNGAHTARPYGIGSSHQLIGAVCPHDGNHPRLSHHVQFLFLGHGGSPPTHGFAGSSLTGRGAVIFGSLQAAIADLPGTAARRID